MPKVSHVLELVFRTKDVTGGGGGSPVGEGGKKFFKAACTLLSWVCSGVRIGLTRRAKAQVGWWRSDRFTLRLVACFPPFSSFYLPPPHEQKSLPH